MGSHWRSNDRARLRTQWVFLLSLGLVAGVEAATQCGQHGEQCDQQEPLLIQLEVQITNLNVQSDVLAAKMQFGQAAQLQSQVQKLQSQLNKARQMLPAADVRSKAESVIGVPSAAAKAFVDLIQGAGSAPQPHQAAQRKYLSTCHNRTRNYWDTLVSSGAQLNIRCTDSRRLLRISRALMPGAKTFLEIGAGRGDFLSHVVSSWGAVVYNTMKEKLALPTGAMCEDVGWGLDYHAFEVTHNANLERAVRALPKKWRDSISIVNKVASADTSGTVEHQTTIDLYVAAAGIQRIDMLKIANQGDADTWALAGAVETISAKRVEMIDVEYSGTGMWRHVDPQSLVAWMFSKGYESYIILEKTLLPLHSGQWKQYGLGIAPCASCHLLFLKAGTWLGDWLIKLGGHVCPTKFHSGAFKPRLPVQIVVPNRGISPSAAAQGFLADAQLRVEATDTSTCDKALLALWQAVPRPVQDGCTDGKETHMRLLSMLINLEKSNSPLTIFDIGANRGFWTAHALNYFTNMPNEAFKEAMGTENLGSCSEPSLSVQKLQIHAFEPRAHGLLTKGMATLPRNIARHVVINKHAVADVVGELPMFDDYTAEHSETASFAVKRSIQGGKRSHSVGKVPVTTVDSYMQVNGISKVHLMKVDTEGFEIWVLAGAAEAIKNQLIDMLIVEVNAINPGTLWHGVNMHELVEKMSTSGYDSFIMHKHALFPMAGKYWNEYGHDPRAVCIWCNLLFMRRSFKYAKVIQTLTNGISCAVSIDMNN